MINKKNVIIISFIIHFLITQILSQVDDCDCQNYDGIDKKNDCNNCPNCRFYDTNNKCIVCQNLSSKPYYIFSGTTEITCDTIKEKRSTDNNYKLIYNTHNIVEECQTSTYTLIEDICYSDNDLNELIGTSNDKKCPKYYDIKEIKDGFHYFECINKCPNGYNYYDDTTGKCLQTCDKYIKTINSEDGTFIYRCSDSCLTNEPTNIEFEYIDESTSKKYCLKQCPKEAQFYYITDYKCLPNCNDNHYSEGDKCIDSCNQNILVNLNKNIFSCLPDNSCPLDYPYIYEKGGKTYCLKSCQDTQKQYFGTGGNNGETTYLEDETNKCLSNKENYFIDLNTFKWVSDCKKASSGPYTNGNLCQSTCLNKITFDTLNCIESCNSESDYQYSIKDSNICYNNCPVNLGKGFINPNDNNECQSCNNPKDPQNPEYGEGFYSEDSTDKKCYLSCNDINPENIYYHNKDENFCFTTECKNTNHYQYQINESKICVNSCEDIKSLGYIYEKNYICYKEKPTILTNEFYYKSSTGIYKITTNDEECLEAGYLFLDNQECVKNCKNNEYKKLPNNNRLGKCFPIVNDDSIPDGCKYYNKTTKICSDECPFFTITYEQYITDNKENCVLECPESLYEKENECQEQCSDTGYFIKEESGKKKCVNKCDKFQLGTESPIKCVEKCTKADSNGNIIFINYYIDENEDKKCKDECDNEEYSLSTEDDHQLCLTECPETHPYHNGKICVDKCDYYLDNDCSNDCGDKPYLHPGNICSDKECPTNAPFYYPKILDERPVKKCVSNCKGYEEKYDYFKINECSEDDSSCIEEKECVQDCTDNYNLIYEGQCLKKCPNGFYVKDSQCVSKCEPNFYKIDTTNDQLICLPECPEADNIYLTSSGQCVSECPEGEKFIYNNKCLSICKDDNGKELFYKKKENSNNYECLLSCEDDVYIEGTKECLPNCNIDTEISLYKDEDNNVCYKTCISNNNLNIYSAIIDGVKICKDRCPLDLSYFTSDKICRNECMSLPFNKTINLLYF